MLVGSAVGVIDIIGPGSSRWSESGWGGLVLVGSVVVQVCFDLGDLGACCVPIIIKIVF